MKMVRRLVLSSVIATVIGLTMVTPVAANDQFLPDRLARSHDELLKRALASFPFAVQLQFADRTIRRPSTAEEIALGLFDSYFPTDNSPRGMAGDIIVGRDEGDDVAVGVAIHELLHAVQFEGIAFADDTAHGQVRLVEAISDNLSTLLTDPRTAGATRMAREQGLYDHTHVFVTMGELYIKGVPLPKAVADYFAPMQWYNPKITHGP